MSVTKATEEMNVKGWCPGQTERENRPPPRNILLANVLSLDNKLEELRSTMAFQRDSKNCNIMVFMETWLDPSILDSLLLRGSPFTTRMDNRIGE